MGKTVVPSLTVKAILILRKSKNLHTKNYMFHPSFETQAEPAIRLYVAT